ncbi:MAG: VanZ family protein, partial [Lachnospiraceae bacterium]|nr:VanZ family protein [Lachnospiraceae bacterium]
AIPLGLFISYLTLLYQKVLGMRELISVQSVFILPFSTITDISRGVDYILNILLFIPLGLLLPMIRENMKEKTVVLTGFVLSLFIEISQFILMAGSCETDDLITNTLGTWIGYLILGRLKKQDKEITGKNNKYEEKNPSGK